MAIHRLTGAHSRWARLFKICIPLALTAVALLMSPAAMTEEAAEASAASDEKMDAILLELKAIRQVLEKIAKQGGVNTAKRPSKPTIATVAIAGRPAMGAEDAPVTVVEFTDYQCPFCLRFSKTTFPHLKKDYIDTGKVRWVALNLPLAFHKDARKAAQGALCAGDQGKFWEMREMLFEHPQQIGMEHLPGYARDLSLDVEAFSACLNSDSHIAAINKDAKDARGVSLTGTPSFIIGKSNSDKITGTVVIGAQPLRVFNDAINQALEQKPVEQKPAKKKPLAG
jgi:protein-disulfide isomerase